MGVIDMQRKFIHQQTMEIVNKIFTRTRTLRFCIFNSFEELFARPKLFLKVCNCIPTFKLTALFKLTAENTFLGIMIPWPQSFYMVHSSDTCKSIAKRHNYLRRPI